MSIEDLYKKIEFQLQQQLPFVAYRKPGTSAVVMLFQKDDRLHTVDDYSESGFVFAPFNGKNKPVLIPSEHHAVYSYENDEIILKNEKTITKNSDRDKSTHLQLVSEAVKTIKEGHFKKVVLSRKEEIEIAHLKVIEVYKKILATYPEACCYLWFHPKVGFWAGATPETLCMVKGNRFETMALAGTRKFEGAVSANWGEKEKEEQQLVTEFIMRQLTPVASNVEASKVYTVKAGNLLHLRTDITGVIQNSELRIQNKGSQVENNKLKDHNSEFITYNLLNALHPTPAVCGYPKEAAKQFILENEGYNRSFYTGFLGELHFSVSGAEVSKDRSAIYVNLRCMEFSGDTAFVYVGGGITAASVPEHEWQETVNKTQTMLSMLH